VPRLVRASLLPNIQHVFGKRYIADMRAAKRLISREIYVVNVNSFHP